MALTRKREWTNAKGEPKVAWIVDYTDQAGKRRYKQFARKNAAENYLTTLRAELRDGVHTPDAASITIAQAAENWLAQARREDLEPATIDAYEQHVRLHIGPFLGRKKLSALTKPDVEQFKIDLLDGERSRAMVSRVLRSLAALIANAERLGRVAKNVARGVRLRRSKREKPRPTIPSKDELRRIVEAARELRPGDKAMAMVLIFAGLRASELRALAWRHVDFAQKTITIDQRVDRKNIMGPPKSASGWRIIPIPGPVVAELKRWKLQCRPSALDLVFPSEAGTPQFHAGVALRFLEPVLAKAGLVQPKVVDGKPVFDKDGNAVFEGRYTLHCLRHAAASLWIDQRASAKRVQTWMGHHSIQVTFDTYGHLFAALEDDHAIVTAAAARLLGDAA